MKTTSNNFGCSTCWPKEADQAWRAFTSMETEVELVNESHFMMTIRSCKKCSQQFLTLFTETIDWEKGEDPQYWTVMPITRTEAYQLSQDSGGIKPPGFPRERKSLFRNSKGGNATIYWGKGIEIGPHD